LAITIIDENKILSRDSYQPFYKTKFALILANIFQNRDEFNFIAKQSKI